MAYNIFFKWLKLNACLLCCCLERRHSSVVPLILGDLLTFAGIFLCLFGGAAD